MYITEDLCCDTRRTHQITCGSDQKSAFVVLTDNQLVNKVEHTTGSIYERQTLRLTYACARKLARSCCKFGNMGYGLTEKDKDNPHNQVLRGNADFKVWLTILCYPCLLPTRARWFISTCVRFQTRTHGPRWKRRNLLDFPPIEVPHHHDSTCTQYASMCCTPLCADLQIFSRQAQATSSELHPILVLEME